MRIFKEHGVPCRHFCAAILFLKGRPQDFVVHEHRLETLKRTYTGTTVPVDQNGLQDDGLKPPVETKRRGRPKERRMKSQAEKGSEKDGHLPSVRGKGA